MSKSTFKKGDILKVKTFKQIKKVSNIDLDGDLYLPFAVDGEEPEHVTFFSEMQSLCGTAFVFHGFNSDGLIELENLDLHEKWVRKLTGKEKKKYMASQVRLRQLMSKLDNVKYARVNSEKQLKKSTTIDQDGDRVIRGWALEDDIIGAAGTVVEVITVDCSDNSVKIILPDGNSWWMPVEWVTPLPQAEARAIAEKKKQMLAALTDKQRAAIGAVKAGNWGCQTGAVKKLISVLAEFPMEAYDA